MRTVLVTIALILGTICIAVSDEQAIPSHYSQHDFLMASSGAFNDGLLGFSNPAVLNFLKNSDSRFYWSTDGTDAVSFNNWGLFLGFPHVGFGVLQQKYGEFKTTDYRISLAGGEENIAFGLSYSWSKADTISLEHERLFKCGLLIRPLKYLSLGLTGDFSVESNARQGVAEIGIRPLGTPRLTLFADMAMQKETKFKDAPWSAGAIVEIVPGINFTGRYFESEAITAGLTIDFCKGSLSSQVHLDNNRDHAYNTYSVRTGSLRPSIFPAIIHKEKMYLKINLKGRVKYQGYMLFDRDTNRFMDLLQDIKAAADDPRISAIVLNLSSM